MKYLLLVCSLTLAGCAQYEQTQLDLIDQARKGVALVIQSQLGQTQRLDELATFRRAQLDEAFDEDVKRADELLAMWVIEHRKAYVVGLEALQQQRNVGQQTVDTTLANLKSIDRALSALQSIHQSEKKILSLEKQP